MSEMTLTVVMSNYNHGRFLRASLDSILAQSRQPEEIIVIDDASTDKSVDILREYEKRCSYIRLIINNQNLGGITNATKLLQIAKGRYFYSAAADDMILPGFFEKSIEILTQHPQAGLCSTLCEIINEDGTYRGLLSKSPFDGKCEPRFVSPNDAQCQLYRCGSWMQGNTVVFQRKALLDVGGFRNELGPYADGFVHSMIALTHGACFIPEPLAAWRQSPNSFSGRTSMNPVAMRRIRDEAIRCMAEDFPALFLPNYVRRWRNRWDSSAMLSFSRAKCNEWRYGLRQLLPPESGCRWLMLVVSQMVVFFAMALVLMAAATLRLFDLGRLLRVRVARMRRFGNRINAAKSGGR